MSLLLALLLLSAHGADRLIRAWTEDDGLPVRKVLDVAQDDEGLLWLATPSGLVRYDGRTFEVVAPDLLDESVQVVVTGPGDALVAAERLGGVVDLSDRARPVPVVGPDGALLDGVRDIAIDATGALWVVVEGRVLRRRGEVWDAPFDGVLDPGEEARRVRVGAGEAAIVLTDRAAWQVGSAGPVRRFTAQGLADAVIHEDGRAVLVLRDGTVEEIGADGIAVPLDLGDFARCVVTRAGVDWVGVGDALYGLRPGQPPDRVPLRRQLGGAVEMLVDHEGSLWVASFQGLLQLPEPDSATLTTEDGLPSDLTDRVAAAPGGAWVVTRSGLARVSAEGVAVSTDLAKPNEVCLDADGTAWTSGYTAQTDRWSVAAVAAAISAKGESRFDLGLGDDQAGCASDAHGRVWLGGGGALWLAQPDGPRRVGPAPEGGDGSPHLVADAADRLWWLGERLGCSAPIAEISAGTVSWTCLRSEEPIHFTGEWTFDDGTVWLATRRHGLVDGAGAPVEGQGAGARGFAPSPRGGVWLHGQRTAVRIDRRGSTVEVLERLDSGDGLVDGSPNDLAEDPDGTLWVATLSGLTRVPASARSRPTPPVTVRLVEVRQDDRVLPPGPISLPYRQNRLDVDFAATSYRDPDHLLWRLRVGDEPGRVVGDPRIRFLALAPGRYDVRVDASADDGATWSPAPAAISFVVRWPWMLRPPALIAFALALGLAAWGVHRARVAFLLGLERQRARIALDLHDEIGSGLGGIGLLAGVLRDVPGEGDRQRSLAGRIADTAEELGTALTDIVWALRRGSESARALVEHLEARGRALFPDPATRFEVVVPDPWPRRTLSLAVRRNVQAVALEALHNAARHAGASRVVLGLAADGRQWRLWVADDGRGIDAGAPSRPGGGSGLDGMRRRAENIGGRLDVETSAAGTTVTVWFGPGAGDRRVEAALEE